MYFLFALQFNLCVEMGKAKTKYVLLVFKIICKDCQFTRSMWVMPAFWSVHLSVFSVNDDENDDENEENIFSYRWRD